MPSNSRAERSSERGAERHEDAVGRCGGCDAVDVECIPTFATPTASFTRSQGEINYRTANRVFQINVRVFQFADVHKDESAAMIFLYFYEDSVHLDHLDRFTDPFQRSQLRGEKIDL